MNDSTLDVQTLMDYAVEQIVKQGGRCVTEDGYCCYINEVCHSCVIGWVMRRTNLINLLKGSLPFPNDGSLQQIVEGATKEGYQELASLIQGNLNLFGSLQWFHDKELKSTRSRWLKEIKEAHPTLNFEGKHFQEWVEMGRDVDSVL